VTSLPGAHVCSRALSVAFVVYVQLLDDPATSTTGSSSSSSSTANNGLIVVNSDDDYVDMPPGRSSTDGITLAVGMMR
jgi:hypothetical protein